MDQKNEGHLDLRQRKTRALLVKALAELPSKEVLQAQALGMMLAPITSLAIVLKAIAEEKGGFVEAAAEPEAAPAE